MRLLEFQAKRMLKEVGIGVPKGTLLASPQDLSKVTFPAVLKVQVPVGGRGKAGAVRVAGNAEEGATIVKTLFATPVKGYPIQALLAEERVEIQKEFYLAYLIDKQANLPVVMASAEGGVEIEEVARKSPEKIIKKHIDPFLGLQDFNIRPLAKALGVDFQTLKNLVKTMVQLFHEKDATLVEINPLAMTSNGLVALDAKILLDDKAAYKHEDLFKSLQAEQKALDKRERTAPEQMVEGTGITYVPLDGDIGVIADGAGTGMLTLDLIHQYGGQAANFCEMGGLSNAETMEKSIHVILSNPRAKVLLIGLIGGMTRMDEMGEGIYQYLKKANQRPPIVVRMCGTKADVGKARLKEVGIETHEDLSAAVREAVGRIKEL
jgi:succinyl-CoA synthetase beta subunit